MILSNVIAGGKNKKKEGEKKEDAVMAAEK